MRRGAFDVESLFGLLVVIVIALVLCITCGGCGVGMITGGFQYSDGHREGTVQKFSTKGYIWKTNEGELAMAGVKQVGEDALSNVFEFTVLDDEIKKELDALHGDDKVRLHYRQYKFSPSWYGNTQYRIWKVEKLK